VLLVVHAQHENREAAMPLPDFRQHFETAAPRQRNIQHHNIVGLFFHTSKYLLGILCLTGDGEVRVLAKDLSQAGSQQRVIVGDQYSNHLENSSEGRTVWRGVRMAWTHLGMSPALGWHQGT
jgi:hypothetical protein